MEHLVYLKSEKIEFIELEVKLTGRYYTHEFIAKKAVCEFLDYIEKYGWQKNEVDVVDPFAGDGRLIYWLIEEWEKRGFPSVLWRIHLWDISNQGLVDIRSQFAKLINVGVSITWYYYEGDSFKKCLEYRERFDIVFTNPPWEVLKPDSRKLKIISKEQKEGYIDSLKNYDRWLSSKYVFSQPKIKFGGWGTNLSRVGLEASHLICKQGGFVIIVLPASFLADEQSENLRQELFANNNIIHFSYFPSEVRLFGTADIESSIIVYSKERPNSDFVKTSVFNKNLQLVSDDLLRLDMFKDKGYAIPFNIGSKALAVLEKLQSKFVKWIDLEKSNELWAGREIDETGSHSWLTDDGKGLLFVKGRMVNRFQLAEPPKQRINKEGWTPPFSANLEKIVWRDVSRVSQKRRMIACIIDKGCIAGNSLGVVLYKEENAQALKILLAIMNSLCFEFQLKAYLSTGHVSLSALRKVNIPSKYLFHKYLDILPIIEDLKSDDKEPKIESYVAKYIYNISEEDFSNIIDTFGKISDNEKSIMISYYRKLE